MPNIVVGQTITKSVDVKSGQGYKYTHYIAITLNETDTVRNNSTLTVKYGLSCASSNNVLMWNGNCYVNLGITTNGTTWSDKGNTTIANWTSGGQGVIKWMDSYVVTVSHNSSGNANFIGRAVFDNATNDTYAPNDYTLTSDTLTLPTLRQLSTVTASPSTLQSGNMTINITRHNTAYTHTVRYRVQNNTTWTGWQTLGTRVTTASFSVPYATVSGLLSGVNVGQVQIECITYNGTTNLGSNSTYIMVRKGALPFGLYDDMAGNVGATVGAEPSSSGFNILLNTQLGVNADRRTFTTYLGTSSTTGEIRHGNVDLADATYTNKVVNVYNGGDIQGSWADYDKYSFYIFECSTAGASETPININMTGIVPTAQFGTAEGESFHQRVMITDGNAEWIVWQFWHDGTTGHFSRYARKNTGVYGHMYNIWGVK